MAALPIRKERFTEQTAFDLIRAFRDARPEVLHPHPGGTDEALRQFMGAEDISTARYWRRRFDRQAPASEPGRPVNVISLVV